MPSITHQFRAKLHLKRLQASQQRWVGQTDNLGPTLDTELDDFEPYPKELYKRIDDFLISKDIDAPNRPVIKPLPPAVKPNRKPRKPKTTAAPAPAPAPAAARSAMYGDFTMLNDQRDMRQGSQDNRAELQLLMELSKRLAASRKNTDDDEL